MTIKLKGSTDGSVSFTAPADTSPTGSDITLTLPTTVGSVNQFLKNSGTAGTLGYSSMVENASGVVQIQKPSDWWSNGSIYHLHEIGQLASEGSYRLTLTSNGYRDTNNQWVSLGVNSFSGASQIGLDPQGPIIFANETTKNTGDAATVVESGRFTAGGDFLVGKTSATVSVDGCEVRKNGFGGFTRTSNICGLFGRNGTDGVLISLRHANNQEGSISVSGTTVSYNGGHLARWSQLAGGAERTEILRGSVLSNLDEMCEWGEENNEQLNRMKVSDVEGDANVSGVFQAWDDDDDTYTNDFYCAMTGDFVIRIAQGTTVARGDLLMSAGDGTAKPQDDDIVRSKTIAKVTSTVVSETYSDGSYCVPCVLMAC